MEGYIPVSYTHLLTTSRSLGLNATYDWKRVKLRSNIQYVGTDRLEDSRTDVYKRQALEERRLTVEFSDASSEVIANLIANALGLQCIRQGDLLLLSE